MIARLAKARPQIELFFGLPTFLGVTLGTVILLLELKSAFCIVMLGVGAAILLRPQIGLLLMIGLFPLETVGRFTAPTSIIQFSILQICGILTLFSWLIHVIVSRSKIYFTWHYVIFAAMGVIATIAVTVAADKKVAVANLIHLGARFSFFFLVVEIISTEKLLKAALWVILLVSLLIASFSVYQRFDPSYHGGEVQLGHKGKGGGMLMEEEGLGILTRTSGFMRHYDELAVYLILPVAVALYMFRIEKSAIMRGAISIVLTVYLAAAASTYARVGAIGIAILISLLFTRGVFKVSPTIVVCCMVLLFVGTLLVPKTYWLRVASLSRYLESESITIRTTIWKEALPMFKDHWLTGVGLGNFSLRLEQYAPDLMFGVPYTAHNTYVGIACEWGLLGLILFFSFFGVTFENLRSVRRTLARDANCSLRLLAYTIEAVFIVYLLSGLAHSLEYQKVWWLVPALAVVVKKISLLDADRRPISHEQEASSLGFAY